MFRRVQNVLGMTQLTMSRSSNVLLTHIILSECQKVLMSHCTLVSRESAVMTRHEKVPLTHTIAERKQSSSPLSPARWMLRHAHIFEEHTAVPSPQRAARPCRPKP
jgi:hypothetical protein